MKKKFIIRALLPCLIILFCIRIIQAEELIRLNQTASHKGLSGLLYEQMNNASVKQHNQLKRGSSPTGTVILYFEDYPSPGQMRELENLGVCLRKETWTSPVGNHP